MQWGISSNGRAPALHAGSTGIDTRILQIQNFWPNVVFSSCLSFLFVLSKIRIYLSPVIFFWSFLFFLYSLFHLLSANETQIVNQDDVFAQSIFNWRWNKGPCRSLSISSSPAIARSLSKMMTSKSLMTWLIWNPESSLANCQAVILYQN